MMDTFIDSVRGAAQCDRPRCMVALGLSPPYAAQDVKQAYLARAMIAHPDAGGDVASFVKLQEAFDSSLAGA